MAVDVRLYNVVMLGLSFMLMFTAFQTSSMIEVTVLQNSPDKNLKDAGFVSLGIIYTVFTFANWLAPPIVSIIGPRASIVLGGICYCLFIASLIYPLVGTLYAASVIVGFGASVIWTGQGNILTINSNADTMSRNSGIFWAMLQCSLLFGNLYVSFAFHDASTISDSIRVQVYTVLTVVCGLGVLLLFFIRKAPPMQLIRQTVKEEELYNDTSSSSTEQQPQRSSAQLGMEAIGKALRLFTTKDMFFLSLCFGYTGLELTFFSGVYSACVGKFLRVPAFGLSGNTKRIPDSKTLVGIVGMVIGAGEILGGLTFGIFGKRTNRLGRDPIILFGMLVHLICFLLIYFNIPANAPYGNTHDSAPAFETPYKSLAIICAFLLGLGDSSYNTQIYSILGFVYQEDSAAAFAIFKFVQSGAAAIAFFYSGHLILQWQLLILVITCIIGSLGFFKVEWKARRNFSQGYTQIK